MYHYNLNFLYFCDFIDFIEKFELMGIFIIVVPLNFYRQKVVSTQKFRLCMDKIFLNKLAKILIFQKHT